MSDKSAPSVSHTTLGPFQARVHPWLLECFGEMIAGDREERNHRFLEEALELVQACGCSASEAHQLVDYVYGRPVGQSEQEVGGVMVTLAALCLANRMDMHLAAENELARIWTMVEKIRAKQAAKPKHSPLPEAAIARPSAPAVAWRERMGPRAAWTPCSKEHHDWVLRAPAEWPGVEVQALAVAGPYVPFKALQAAFAMRSPTCWCESCDAIANDGHRSRMSLCPSCGDKRCPRALHHEHPCQKGAAHGQPT